MTFDNFIRSFFKIDKGLKENMPHSYLRVMANVEFSKALKTKAFIKNDDGSTRWLAFKYEKLLDFCFSCGKSGHNIAGCDEDSKTKMGQVDYRRAYGIWM